jgi:DNA-binding NarL/FixJ family response regulator
VDISLANGSGIELIKSIKAGHPGVAALVLSMHDELLYAERALRAGAGGYIMKSEATQKVIQPSGPCWPGRFMSVPKWPR